MPHILQGCAKDDEFGITGHVNGMDLYLKEFILSEMLMFYCAAHDIFFIFEINV